MKIPFKEKTDYTIGQTYVKKKLTLIYANLIFKRFLLKIATECKFTFSKRYYQQTDAYTMDSALFHIT